MNGKEILIGIACLCWLAGVGVGFWPRQANVAPNYSSSISAVSAGLLFYGISLLIRG